MRQQSAGHQGRPRDRATDEAIRSAALAVLREAGYPGFAIEAVAARSGVAKTSIYRRWPSRGALLVDLYTQALAEARPLPEGGPARKRLAALLGQTAARLADPLWSRTLASIVSEAQADPDTRALLRERIVEPRRASARALIEEAVVAGEAEAPRDVGLVLDGLFGTFWYRLLLGHAAIDAGLAASLVDAVLPQAGSAAPSGSARHQATKGGGT